MIAEASAAPVQRNAKVNPEPVVEQAADRTTLPEQHQQREADDDRRQYQRKVNDGVDQVLPGKSSRANP